jgi:hypothetical protein
VEVRPVRVIIDRTPLEVNDKNLVQNVSSIFQRLVFDLRLPVPVRDKSRETLRDYFDFLVKNYKEYFPKIGIQLEYT